MKPRQEDKKSRFQIEKLEERIAPIVHPLVGSLGVSLPDGSGGGQAVSDGTVGDSSLGAPLMGPDPSTQNPSP